MSPTVHVGLVQIAGLNWTQRQTEQYCARDGVLASKNRIASSTGHTFVYLPYSVGMIEAYAKANAGDASRFAFMEPLFTPIPVGEAVARLAPADVVGFSCYVWNIERSLRIARDLKATRPDRLVVLGGPQVPDHAEAFLHAHPFVDIVCHGEGERVFLQILEAAADRDWSTIPGVSFVAADGTFVSNPRLPRVKDLTAFPSPYLNGTFDGLMRGSPDYEWIAMWETNRGCPFSCTFCDWGSAVSSKINKFEMERLEAEAEWFAANRIKHVFICDANFGILPRDVDLTRHIVGAYERHHAHLGLGLQSTKTATNRTYEIQRIITGSSTVAMATTLSMQSLNDETLKSVKRSNISLDVFRDLQRRYKADGVATYSDLIIGMPGETYDSFADGVGRLIADGQHNLIAFYNCSILPNAEMGDPQYQRTYGMEYVPSRIVQAHDSLDDTERSDVFEFLNTVTATAAMAPHDWCRARMFADMVGLLHFERVLQVALVVAVEHHQATYRELIESVLNADRAEFPICGEIAALFADHAHAIQAGQPEYIASPEWLNLWWPADQYALVKLVVEHKLTAFYDELERVLVRALQARGGAVDQSVIHEAVALNQAMLRVPYEKTDLDVELSCDLLAFYRAAVAGLPAVLDRRRSRYRIDRSTTVWLSWRAWAVDVTTQKYSPEAFLYEATDAAAPAPEDLLACVPSLTGAPLDAR